MKTHPARICVLYSDLVLEVSGALHSKQLVALDEHTDKNNRRDDALGNATRLMLDDADN